MGKNVGGKVGAAQCNTATRIYREYSKIRIKKMDILDADGTEKLPSGNLI
jgi:hypothetical protein